MPHRPRRIVQLETAMRKTAVSVDDGTVGLWGVADRVKRPAPRHTRPPIGQARREQRLPPAAQLRGPAPGGLPGEAPGERAPRSH
jgi:hypothetical protein